MTESNKIQILTEILCDVFVCARTVLGFELRAYTLSHSTSLIFCEGIFQDRVS
jgi:hypothetical protein